jgi:hypothetical protein
LLRELDDADKHRLIEPGTFAVSQADIVIHPAVVPLKINFPDRAKAVENNAKVAWVLFPKPQPDVRVKFNLTLAVGVTHDPSKYGHTWTPIGDLVSDVGNEVFRVVAELERVA